MLLPRHVLAESCLTWVTVSNADTLYVAQTINVLFWMLPHIWILSRQCAWFDLIINISGLIRQVASLCH